MLTTGQILVYTVILGAVIFFCRVLPFLVFRDGMDTGKSPAAGRGSRRGRFLAFVENAAPPAAMTVLAVNALAAPVREALEAAAAGVSDLAGNSVSPEWSGLVMLAASALLTAALHLWKRNALLSIFSGTALYMALGRLIDLFKNLRF